MPDQLDCVGAQPRKCNGSGVYENLGTPCAAPTPMCTNGTCMCPNTLCGNVCMDTSSELHHCGSCDWDCRIGTCQRGNCLPQVLVTMRNFPGSIAVDDQNIYWVEANGDKVWKAPKIGGDPVAIASVNSPTGLEIVGTHLYFGSAAELNVPGQILKLSTKGGTPTPLYTGDFIPGNLVVQGGFVYWIPSAATP